MNMEVSLPDTRYTRRRCKKEEEVKKRDEMTTRAFGYKRFLS